MKKLLVSVTTLALALGFLATSILADDAKDLKGVAGCSMCAFKAGGGCGSSVKIDGKVYTLKASGKADEATQKLIASFKGAGKPTAITIKGIISGDEVVADSVTKAKKEKKQT